MWHFFSVLPSELAGYIPFLVATFTYSLRFFSFIAHPSQCCPSWCLQLSHTPFLGVLAVPCSASLALLPVPANPGSWADAFCYNSFIKSVYSAENQTVSQVTGASLTASVPLLFLSEHCIPLLKTAVLV